MVCNSGAAHPRSRGEHLANSLKLCYVTGSSPLARGTLLIFGAGAGIPRLIPARAGNTDPRKQVGDSVTAHPRSRGEHYAKNPISSIRNGSSPLARGTPPRNTHPRGDDRLIPARAGNTPRFARRADSLSAHPRSRGEHRSMVAVYGLSVGSSPLARGTQSVQVIPGGYARLIPARAGNTSSPQGRRSAVPAHPRSRGEHCPIAENVTCSTGSSPLARGTRGFLPPPALPGRLIPARAGNTKWDTAEIKPAAAHPRSRGEHGTYTVSTEIQSGSSPLARGTRCAVSGARGWCRLIPARAGNTAHLLPHRLARSAHPRSRGEHIVFFRVSNARRGSSPLARGTHLLTWGFTSYISKIESLWSQSLHPEYTINNRS